MSALVGLDSDLALTSATSSGGPLRSNLGTSNGLKWMASTTMCSRTDQPIALASRRLPGAASTARNGSDMVRGSRALIDLRARACRPLRDGDWGFDDRVFPGPGT